ncbi:hypothetical protein PVAP13_1NG467495 [Panicum virgatum]|uniref:Transmembrane protein n=1 Tax=Panicum virgatum TaxID=38727 RepID=A0A8T0X8I1_PANVG|nr:hypothetical protein PVAP13_1NG467495 [Panicum virgatum]
MVESSQAINWARMRTALGIARFRKGIDASRAVLLALAAVTSLALIAAGSLVTTRTALFLLSNAILALLAADCPWFFAAAGASASDVAGACELPGGALQKQQAQRNQEEARRCAAKPRNRAGTASEEAFTDPVMTSGSTTTLEVLEEQEDAPATSTTELLGLLDEGDSITLGGLDELEIDELNKKFDEFIQSRSKWIKEEEAYLQWHQA